VDAGDYVSVTNATQVHLSGKKGEDKVYRHYSGFMGGLKEVPIGRMRERRGEDVSHGFRVCFCSLGRGLECGVLVLRCGTELICTVHSS
jgi:hypothetical protein